MVSTLQRAHRDPPADYPEVVLTKGAFGFTMLVGRRAAPPGCLQPILDGEAASRPDRAGSVAGVVRCRDRILRDISPFKRSPNREPIITNPIVLQPRRLFGRVRVDVAQRYREPHNVHQGSRPTVGDRHVQAHSSFSRIRLCRSRRRRSSRRFRSHRDKQLDRADAQGLRPYRSRVGRLPVRPDGLFGRPRWLEVWLHCFPVAGRGKSAGTSPTPTKSKRGNATARL